MAKTQQTTQELKLPEWMNSAGQNIVNQAQQFFQQPFQEYTGQRVAGLTNEHGQALSDLTGMNNSGADIINAAKAFFAQGFQPYTQPMAAGQSAHQTAAATDLDALRADPSMNADLDAARGAIANATTKYNAAGQPITTERVVDEGGRLGAIGDYTNPYVDARLAPSIRAMEEAAGRRRNELNAEATFSGAFGDAQSGVQQGMLTRDLTTAIGDASGAAHADAFDNAMALRSGDLARFFGVDTANRDASLASAGGLLNAAGAGAGLAGQKQDMALDRIGASLGIGDREQATEQNRLDKNYGETLAGREDQYNRIDKLISGLQTGQSTGLDRIAALISGGNIRQQNAQNVLDANYEAYNTKRMDQYDRLAALVSSISGAPHGSTQVNTEPKSSFPILQLIGSVIGAALPG